jgi:ribosomal protein S18 acetylase RimI-like enzyme
VHPDRSDRGLGTALLAAVTGWLFAGGMASVGVDVAASNGRAVRCYEKAGFERTGTLWRPAPDLARVDLAERYAFLREHLREGEAGPELRFWLMELRAPLR